MEVFTLRYSHLYAAVQNRPSLLVETHSLKTTRTRAWADYDIMRHTFDTILLDPEGLRRAVREADREMMSRAGNRSAPPVYLAGKVSAKSRPLVYHALKTDRVPSSVTGGSVTRYTGEPDDIETVIHDQIDTTVEAQMPLGYLVPAAWSTSPICWRCTASRCSAPPRRCAKSLRRTASTMFLSPLARTRATWL